MKYILRGFATALAVAVAAIATPVSAAPAHHAHHSHAYRCAKPVRLSHPESLGQWFRRTGIDPAIELSVAARCWDHHGGWTPNLASLILGKYGPDLWTAKLPVGTRLWDQL